MSGSSKTEWRIRAVEVGTAVSMLLGGLAGGGGSIMMATAIDEEWPYIKILTQHYVLFGFAVLAPVFVLGMLIAMVMWIIIARRFASVGELVEVIRNPASPTVTDVLERLVRWAYDLGHR